MQWKVNRAWRVVFGFIALLVLFRLALPYIVTRYVAGVLRNIPGYRCTIEDVDVHLLRGAYQIDSLRVYNTAINSEEPFVVIPSTFVSIEWPSLVRGSAVGEITLVNPVMHISASNNLAVTKTYADWTDPICKLLPFDLNKFTVQDGRLIYSDALSHVAATTLFSSIQIEAINLSNAKDNPEDLPSRIYLQALSMGNGQLNAAARVNVEKSVPDLDMDIRFENVNMNALRDLLNIYADTRITSGNLNFYAEIAVQDSRMKGYVKPVLNGVRVEDAESAKEINGGWKSIATYLTHASGASKQERVSQVAIDEMLPADSSFWQSMWNIANTSLLRCFYVAEAKRPVSVALSRQRSTEPAVAAAGEKSGKELRKERRKEKREARRARREKKKDQG